MTSTGQRHDLHEVLFAELTGDRTEDARAARVVFLVDHDGRVLVEADIGAVPAAGDLPRADDDAADDSPCLTSPPGWTFFTATDDHVADVGDFALELALGGRAAQDLDAHGQLGAGVVGDVEIRFAVES